MSLHGFISVFSAYTMMLRDFVTVSQLDYVPLTSVRFDACQRVQCALLNITDDDTVERTETFSVALLRSPDLDSRIHLSTANASVFIIDNDGELCMCK